MKCPDVMLSVMLHAGIVAGAMYGISHYEDDPVDDDIMEPVFFEILEESMVAAADAPSKPDEPAPPVPKEGPAEIPEEVEPVPVPEPSAEAAPEALVTEKENDPADPGPIPPGPLPKLPPQKPEEPVPEPPEESGSEPVQEQENIPAPEFPENTVENAGPEAPSPSTERATVPETAVPADRETAKVVSAPVACARIVPRYPRSARRRGREGAVTLDVSVSGSGEVSGVEVLVSSGHGDLDGAAVSAVRSARFAPATEDGVSVSGSVRLTFEFRLR